MSNWNIKTDPVTGLMKFALVDSDGDVVASFRLNPTDIRMASRFEEAAVLFNNLAQNAPSDGTVAELKSYNDKLEETLADILGGNAKETLFSTISAITIMPTGALFAVEVFDEMYKAVAPEIAARKEKMQAAASKYTAKYESYDTAASV